MFLEKHRTNVEFPLDMWNMLKAEAEETGNSIGSIIRNSVKKHFDDKEGHL